MKNLEFFLRQFKKADLPAVLKIEKLSFATSLQSASRFKKYAQYQLKRFIVAEINDKVVGYIVGRLTDKKGKIVRVAIDPRYRREGVGHQLAFYMLNYFKKQKIKQIQVEVRINNQGSIKFFQSLGFEISKRLKKYYSDGSDAYLMEKREKS